MFPPLLQQHATSRRDSAKITPLFTKLVAPRNIPMLHCVCHRILRRGPKRTMQCHSCILYTTYKNNKKCGDICNDVGPWSSSSSNPAPAPSPRKRLTYIQRQQNQNTMPTPGPGALRLITMLVPGRVPSVHPSAPVPAAFSFISHPGSWPRLAARVDRSLSASHSFPPQLLISV